MFFERYDKEIMEQFAKDVISKSFDYKYFKYIKPVNTDNFDFISPDGLNALEVTSVIPKNVLEAYQYEKEMAKGKTNLKKQRIKEAVFKDDGSLSSYYGGSFGAIIKEIKNAVEEKNTKAKRRKELRNYDSVDLCICVQDGGLMDLYSYKIAGFAFDNSEFDNIFFITQSFFFRYSKNTGFEEYQRVIK